VSDEAIALAFRTGLPYVGLRDHEHDPELDDVVPPDAARFARAIPLAAADDHVRLAVADPEPDLAALTHYLGDRRVELAIAPRDELEELLGPPPPEPPEPVLEEEPEADALAATEPAPAEAEAELLAAAEPAAVEAPGSEEAEPEADPLAAAEPEPPAPAEPLAAAAEPEPLAPAEPEPEPLAPAEPEPLAAMEPAAVEAPGSEEAEPEADPLAVAEPEPLTAAAPDTFAPASPATEEPSWLEPPRKRGWLRAIGRFLLYLLVLALICGAVAAYLLTR
jgi:hypothetical protein